MNKKSISSRNTPFLTKSGLYCTSDYDVYRMVREELDGARGVLGDINGKRISGGAQLLKEAFLHLRDLDITVEGDLPTHQLHLLAEVDAHHLVLLTTEAIGD